MKFWTGIFQAVDLANILKTLYIGHAMFRLYTNYIAASWFTDNLALQIFQKARWNIF